MATTKRATATVKKSGAKRGATGRGQGAKKIAGLTKTSKTAGLYSVHPGVAMVQRWVETLKEKTGKSLDEWMRFIQTKGPKEEKACRRWLKTEHGIGTNTAWWLAERARGGETSFAEEDPAAYLAKAPELVEAMFAGGKEGLRPIYDALLALGLSLGEDVKACPCQTIVPLYREHVFAQLKPTTRTRLDLGLALKNAMKGGKPVAKGLISDRLVDTGGLAKKDRITHRIGIESLEDIDETVKGWLRVAYEVNPPRVGSSEAR